jgi:hypothetical protein
MPGLTQLALKKWIDEPLGRREDCAMEAGERPIGLDIDFRRE